MTQVTIFLTRLTTLRQPSLPATTLLLPLKTETILHNAWFQLRGSLLSSQDLFVVTPSEHRYVRNLDLAAFACGAIDLIRKVNKNGHQYLERHTSQHCISRNSEFHWTRKVKVHAIRPTSNFMFPSTFSLRHAERR
jgi:hypothetical protein